jgi:hypothetical protein
MAERVEIKICIGLFGVCVISILSDSDGVNDDISCSGVQDWYDELPEHEAPIEGIYTVVTDVSFYEDDIVYNIIETKINV